MSFSSDLWNGFDIINEDFIKKRSELKHILHVLSDYSNLENEFAEGLQHLTDLQCQRTIQGTLGNSIEYFFKYLSRQANIHKEQSSLLHSKVINPFQTMVQKQMETIQKIYEDITANETSFKVIINTIKAFQMEFFAKSQEFSNSLIEIKLAEDNPNLKNDQRKKFIANKDKASKNANDAKAVYINYIDKANMGREIYNSNNKHQLNALQKLDEDFIHFIKETFQTFEDIQKEKLRQLQIEDEKHEAMSRLISPDDDVKEFINQHSTTQFPPLRFEFNAYKPGAEITNYKNKNGQYFIPTEISTEIKSTLREELKYVHPKYDYQSNKQFFEIENAIKLLWEGTIDSTQKSLLFNHIKESKTSIPFMISSMNRFRPLGLFVLSEPAYDLFVEILSAILDYCDKEKEYEIVKSIITLSNSFYKGGKDPKDPRVDLQKGILRHCIFQQVEIWKGIIKYSINDQVVNNSLANVKDGQKKIKDVVRATLVNNSFFMSSFRVPKQKIIAMVDYFCKVYEIHDQAMILNSANWSESDQAELKTEVINTTLFNTAQIELVNEKEEDDSGKKSNSDKGLNE